MKITSKRNQIYYLNGLKNYTTNNYTTYLFRKRIHRHLLQMQWKIYLKSQSWLEKIYFLSYFISTATKLLNQES